MPDPITLTAVTLHAVPDDPGTLEIHATTSDGRRFQTRVTGEGFTPQQLDRLFLAFSCLMAAAVQRDPFVGDALNAPEVVDA